MRGKIDLTGHKLAGLYRAPAMKSRWRRQRLPKCPDQAYRQLWRVVDGAVRDTFANHPEYLTDKGRRDAQLSIVKRVAGSLHGYAAQVARGRSEAVGSLPTETAAKRTCASSKGAGSWMQALRYGLVSLVSSKEAPGRRRHFASSEIHAKDRPHE